MGFYTLNEAAAILKINKQTLRRWDSQKKLKAKRHPFNNYRIYPQKDVEELVKKNFFCKETEPNYVLPQKRYNSIELFAGAGGLALGLHQAGIDCVLLNEIDVDAANTLRKNMPNWNIINGDIRNLSCQKYEQKIDIVTGGFPCQAFSYAGKKLGFNDTRGTLFYEFARIVNEVKPKIFMAENVRGLLNHDKGRTLSTIIKVLEEVGYKVYKPQVLKAILFSVPQKRERLIIIGVRNDIQIQYHYPNPKNRLYTLKDALKKGDLYDTDVPYSIGVKYPITKEKILDLIPPGGYWRNLPVALQKKYMMKSFYLSGGKTGIARRISWDEPSLTLTCSPCQKQTERCHPDETRPFTVREYARIQTFPDNWLFSGTITSQYQQIGNAVPVNLAKEIGFSIVNFLNSVYEKEFVLANNTNTHFFQKKSNYATIV